MSTTTSVDEKQLTITVGEHRELCAAVDIEKEKNEHLGEQLARSEANAEALEGCWNKMLDSLGIDDAENRSSLNHCFTRAEHLVHDERGASERAHNLAEEVKRQHEQHEAILGTNKTLGEEMEKLRLKITQMEAQQGRDLARIKELEIAALPENSMQNQLTKLEHFLDEARNIVAELGPHDRRSGDPDEEQ
jgi:phosphotransferase system IIB component